MCFSLGEAWKHRIDIYMTEPLLRARSQLPEGSALRMRPSWTIVFPRFAESLVR